jgi:two-component system chemotaxis response regulator CheY
MSGIELLQKVRMDAELSSLNFVLITSGSDRDTVQKAIMLNVGGYIVKPFNADGATEKIKEILAKYWKNVAEEPLATTKRLAISAEKLNAYFDAFKAQLNKFIAESDTVEDKQIEGQIDAMQTGCLTLGLWHNAKELEKLKNKQDKRNLIKTYLKTVISTVEYQLAHLK